ncbi:MAG: carbohydrate ABC transporter permease [Clostridiales bacterium]|nr:carbohydrate ABC transporter permease [Clostridiales bacterium]
MISNVKEKLSAFFGKIGTGIKNFKDRKKKQGSGKTKDRSVLFNVVSIIWLLLFSLTLLMPFYVIIITSFTPRLEIMSSMQFIWWPKEFSFQAYTEAFTNDLAFTLESHSNMIILGFFNTLWQTIPTVIVGLFFSGLSAYAFCRMEFPARNVLFYVTLATMIIPTGCLAVTSYLMYDKLGWTGSPLPIIIPGLFGSAGTMFFLKQFYSGVPKELFEAGKLDGMSHIQLYIRIMLPLTVPAMLAQFIFGFVGGYNNYQGPLLYLNGIEELYPMQLVMSNLQKQFNLLGTPVICAFAVLGLLPLIIVFLICQKFFIQGVAVTGLK